MHLKPSIKRALARSAFALLCFLLTATSALAHAPFDNSVHAILGDKSLEVSVTMGGEAAQQFLKFASPDNPISLDGMGAKTLPVEIATRLCELKSGTVVLAATLLQVNGDGLEYTFTATYPHPATAALSFHGLYLDAIEPMKSGTFVLANEIGQQIGAALLTKGSTLVALSLTPSAQSTAIVATTTDTPASQMPLNLEHSFKPGSRLFTVLTLLLLIAAAGGFWLVQKRSS